jgi:hypothetical protein
MPDQQHFGRTGADPVRQLGHCALRSLIGRTVLFAVMSELLYDVSDHIAT